MTWCNVRKVFELRAGENAAYVDLVAAMAAIQDRAAARALPTQTIQSMNRYGIEPWELEDWNRLKRSGQYTSAEAADIILRSRRGQRP